MSGIFHTERFNDMVQEGLIRHSQPETSRFYAGIGARNTPDFYLDHMSAAGKSFAEQGMVLRSGGAPGADKAFEKHLRKWKHKDIYLPFRNFGRSPSYLHGSTNAARELVLKHHPNPSAITETAMDYLGRNAHQILGPKLETPVEFVIAYTIKGMPVGGTGTALRIARAHEIPIFNFGNMSISEVQLGAQKIVMKN